jgi:16S rRNA (cytidine1402-2'-O)-methyltransferase
VAVTRELTKRHEQQVGPTLSSALAHFRSHSPQGEFTLVLGGAEVVEAQARSEAELLEDLQALLDQGLSRNEAARQLAQQTGLAKRELYALLHQGGEAN